MVVLSAEQIRAWDRYTIDNLPIPSIDLMERAAAACVKWLEINNLIAQEQFYIFCGKGNNGGDGLAIARLLQKFNRPVDVFILETGHLGSPDFQQNLHRLHTLPVTIHFIQESSPFPDIPEEVLIIDALLGTGLNRPASGRVAELIMYINRFPNAVISIDLPSGLFTDQTTIPNPCIKAGLTLSFQCYKTALLMAENSPYYGVPIILDIGLDPRFLKSITPPYELSDKELVHAILQPRPAHAHKGNFGHALLLAGSYGKMGAAVLAAKACLRSGAGLLTTLVPHEESIALPIAIPETMSAHYQDQEPGEVLADTERFKTIGIGPGLGQDTRAKNWLHYLIQKFRKPMVLDADALNILSVIPGLLEEIPAFSILTPHPKEFDRLAPGASNDFERMNAASRLAIQYQVIIVLKGHHSFIAMPGGRAWFNTTGNAAMAKGGSGDVLTGILTGLLARGYSPEQAVLLGVYLHGTAGEIASRQWGMESVLATDLIDSIGAAFLELQSA
ncbi:NAD(P)H-hydrate dehydratase [Flavihumibacter sp. UBA7668]|uniref:NAD(P)H-hydrate dehydratase n=1 Tax=Flavihumibacter sp. UBA7668 TaxID=1946542 RepID=UPI0025C450E5|nr:NAD(P)H-hydrate dehydratase [Flavihumibacter sp. UBA7668]